MIMKKVFFLLAMFLILGSSAGLAQESDRKQVEGEVWDVRDLKDPNNERRSIGYELTPARSPESEESERQKEREEAYKEAKKERRAKVRRLRGEE
jgi:hypothetical protein